MDKGLDGKELSQKLMEIYESMYACFGPRHWWPADSRFEVIIGAILTQFVSWKNVETAIEKLKAEGLLGDDYFLSIERICDAEDEKLEKLIRSTRFYKQKARKLKEFCRHVKEKYDGSLERFLAQDAHVLREELLSLYGIGEETADSILLYAAEKPAFVVDAYTRRIFGRLGLVDESISYGGMQKLFMDNLNQDVQLFNEYHALIVAAGNNFCANTEPKCIKCPLNRFCLKV